MGATDKGFFTKRHEATGHPLKYYRVVRKTMAKLNGLSEAELEVLIQLDDEYFTKKRFKEACLTNSWDSERFEKLLADEWFESWRDRGYRTAEIFKHRGKTHQLVSRIYRILAGKEELPTSTRRNYIMQEDNKLDYMDKLLKRAIIKMTKERDDNNKNPWEE